jgi:hypothetical protein
MLDTNSSTAERGVRRVVLLAVLTLAFAAAAAGQARATVQIETHTDPAGDTAPFTYQVTTPDGQPPTVFQQRDGELESFGPFNGTVVAQAAAPAGWVLADIQCVGPTPRAFAVDVPNTRVTIQHGITDEQFCSFTWHHGSAPVIPSGGSVGVAPTINPQTVPKVSLPRRAALLGSAGRRGYGVATIRVYRRSVLSGRLVTRGGRVVGSYRRDRPAGLVDFRVDLSRQYGRQLRRRGVRRVTLTLRVAVVPRGGGATQVFTPHVVVRV